MQLSAMFIIPEVNIPIQVHLLVEQLFFYLKTRQFPRITTILQIE